MELVLDLRPRLRLRMCLLLVQTALEVLLERLREAMHTVEYAWASHIYRAVKLSNWPCMADVHTSGS